MKKVITQYFVVWRIYLKSTLYHNHFMGHHFFCPHEVFFLEEVLLFQHLTTILQEVHLYHDPGFHGNGCHGEGPRTILLCINFILSVHADDDDNADFEGDDFSEFEEDILPRKRRTKGKNGVKNQQEKRHTQQKEPKTAAENTGKAEAVVPGATKAEESKTTVVNQDAAGINTVTSTITPTPVQTTTQTTQANHGNQDDAPSTQTASQTTQVTTQATQVNQGTTANSVINPSPSTEVTAQTTASAVEDIKAADPGQVVQPQANNGTPAVQQRPGAELGDGATDEDEKLQPRVTFSDDKTFDRRIPPKVPPTLPTVLQTSSDGKDVPSGEGKTDPVPQEKPSETPTKGLSDVLNQPTAAPTSTAETVAPGVKDHENVTEKAARKSFGILKGFWKFHEFLGMKMIQFGQPLKGALRGILSCIGLGQVCTPITSYWDTCSNPV